MKTSRSAAMRNYSPKDLQRAMNAVREGGMKLYKAAKVYKVPNATLRRHIKRKASSLIPLLGRKPKNPRRLELKEAAKDMEHTGLKQSRNDLLPLVSYIKKSGVDEYFTKLESLLDELIPQGLEPHMIYNLSEIGFTLVTRAGKILEMDNCYRVRRRKSSENIIVMATVNATGSHILPPTVVDKGDTINEDLIKDAIKGAVFTHSPQGIDADLFESWFDRFIDAIPAARPVLLLLGDYASHFTITILNKARSNQIYILRFPLRTPHYYHPLIMSVLTPLKIAFQVEVVKHLKKKPMTKTLLQFSNQYGIRL